MMSVKSMFLQTQLANVFRYPVIPPVNDDVSVSLHQTEGDEEVKLWRRDDACSPDGLPDSVHPGIAELSLEVKEKPVSSVGCRR